MPAGGHDIAAILQDEHEEAGSQLPAALRSSRGAEAAIALGGRAASQDSDVPNQ
jgi:hypothetical protein